MMKTSILASAIAAATLGACAVEDMTTAPIATFQSRTGTTIEMYALDKGFSAVELGEAGMERAISHTDMQTLSPSALYMKASGTDVVPDEVTALTAELGPRRPVDVNFGPLSIPSAPSFQQRDVDGCSAQAFTAGNHCPSGNVSWCLLNHFNGAYEHIGNTDDTYADLCMKSGTAIWQIQNGRGGFHQWSIGKGQFLWYLMYTDDIFGTYNNYDVLDAHGSEFQFGGMAN